MHPPKTYFVYIMSNRSKTLYTGVTNSLVRRVREHKMGLGSCFAAKYKLDRLVYFERFEDIRNAIERERVIKGWLRIKNIALIVSVNPAWRDLSQEWYERHQFQPDCRRTTTPTPISLNCHPERRTLPRRTCVTGWKVQRSFAAKCAAQDDRATWGDAGNPTRHFPLQTR
ncbi:MAG: GIY-YIG nuclease family protein [Acidobacteriia bacterium]|nr:GIY-YIG nuclease family protein [Terriglobia bacterium]